MDGPSRHLVRVLEDEDVCLSAVMLIRVSSC
jgi:hypothetical protein